MNRNYPQNRKPTDNLTQYLLNRYGEPYLKKLWQDNGGATFAARILAKETGYWIEDRTFHYLAKKFDWKRRIRPDHPLVKYVLSGKTNRGQYRHLIFPWEEEYQDNLD